MQSSFCDRVALFHFWSVHYIHSGVPSLQIATIIIVKWSKKSTWPFSYKKRINRIETLYNALWANYVSFGTIIIQFLCAEIIAVISRFLPPINFESEPCDFFISKTSAKYTNTNKSFYFMFNFLEICCLEYGLRVHTSISILHEALY